MTLPLRHDNDKGEYRAPESALGTITWRMHVVLRAGTREVAWTADRHRVVVGLRRPRFTCRLALVDPACSAGGEPLRLLDDYGFLSRQELADMARGTSNEEEYAKGGTVVPRPPLWLLSPVALSEVLAARWKERLLAPPSHQFWPPSLTIRDPARGWPTDLEGTARLPLDLVANGRPVARLACLATGATPDQLTGHGGLNGIECDEMQVLPLGGLGEAAGGRCVGVASMRPMRSATRSDLYACTLLAGPPPGTASDRSRRSPD